MTPVAIDISDSIIRLACIERRGRTWTLPVRAEIPVPVGCIVDGDIKQPQEVIGLLKSLLAAAGTKSRRVTFAIPERHSFVKLVSLTAEQAKDPQAAIAQILPQDIPYNLDEVYWDWSRADQPDSLGQTRALIAAAPKITVDEYLHLFHDAGLQAVAAEVESIAIARAVLGPEPPEDARIVIDLGRSRSTLIMVDRGVVQFSSTLRYAGRELNQFIADELHITTEQAERAKTLFGLDQKRGKGLLRQVLLPHMDALATAIGEAEEYYQEHFVDHRPISSVQLTGSGALVRHIDIELQARLQIPVVTAPSWMSKQLAHHDEEPATVGYTYTTALGLAMTPWFSA